MTGILCCIPFYALWSMVKFVVVSFLEKYNFVSWKREASSPPFCQEGKRLINLEAFKLHIMILLVRKFSTILRIPYTVVILSM